MTPLAPSDVVKALRRVDPTLDLRWMRHMDSWAVIAPWRPSDPRHGAVQRGELGSGAAFDVVCHLPSDCPVAAAEDYLRRGLMSSARADILKMLDQLHDFNKTQADANEERAIAPVLDDLDSIGARRLTNTSASFVNDATQKKRKR
jgi:hypothetical protein